MGNFLRDNPQAKTFLLKNQFKIITPSRASWITKLL